LRHTAIHTKLRHGAQAHIPRPISCSQKKLICQSAVYAVCEDLLPFSFADHHPGLTEYTNSVFQAEQATVVSDFIDIPDMMPSKDAMGDAVVPLANKVHKNFKKNILDLAVYFGGGMNTDGLTMKVQDKHFNDLTFHNFESVS